MKDDINGLIVCGIIFFVLLGISMLLRSGRGAILLNGYNIMSREKKARYKEQALCRYFGNVLLFADLYLILVLVAGIFEVTWLIILLTVILIVICIGTTINAYTNPQFRK